MKIALTGGGTGGHFYPLIAVAEAIEDIVSERTLIEPELYYFGPEPFDVTALIEHDVTHVPSPAGKIRRYPSVLNVLGGLSTFAGVVKATMQLFSVYPDVVFSTGGYAAFPTLYAAKILRIPVVIYDADATPGMVSLWSSKFARWIAVAHPDAASAFPEKVRDRIARTGHPVRKGIEIPAAEGGVEFLHLDGDVPTILFLGGSQGAKAINEVVIDALPELLRSYNVVHQAGALHVEEISGISKVELKDHPHQERYRVFGLLNELALRMAAGVASVVVARAGSGTIFEVASWGIPAILVPIPPDISHDQTENAFSYARAGAGEVIEQRNLSPHVLISEVNRLMLDPKQREKMRECAKAFARPNAARKIATILLEETVSHQAV